MCVYVKKKGNKLMFTKRDIRIEKVIIDYSGDEFDEETDRLYKQYTDKGPLGNRRVEIQTDIF